jgi:hypothetical protein
MARSLEHEIYFTDMDLIVTWPKNKMAFKQSGYKLILGDEVSTWPEFSADMMRKRTDTYSFSHIACVSSMDPQRKISSIDDPIYQEYMNTDQRSWMMPDPETGKLFKFEMGSLEAPFGLKWDQRAKDGRDNWDYKKVRASAYYQTPDGTRIDNKDRMKIVRAGQWVAGKPDKGGPVRGYHINAFYMPFKSGDFGTIAVAFLKAKAKGKNALKVFIYEYLAEAWVEDVDTTEDDELYKRCRQYVKGECFAQTETFKEVYVKKPTATYVTVDVQKAHQWVVAREWVQGGDSGLIDYKYVVTWEDVEKFANDVKARRVLVDYGYAQRQFEVFEYALHYAAWPCKGSDKLSLPFKKTIIDPFEGKHGQGQAGQNIATYSFHTDIFKTLLMDMLRGESEKHWYLYDLIERDYVRKVASEERVEGEWRMKRGHGQNHLWDCEVMQLLAATIEGLYRSEWLEL